MNDKIKKFLKIITYIFIPLFITTYIILIIIYDISYIKEIILLTSSIEAILGIYLITTEKKEKQVRTLEKAKFPMPTLRVTQGYDIGTHKGTYALDLGGEDTGIDWVLAPFTGTIKKTLSDTFGNWYWFESNEEVLCANGEIIKLTAMFGHDNKMRHRVGDVIRQGEILCAEGTSGNATGNHCHLEIGVGPYVGTWYKNQYGIYMLYNAVKPNEYLCVPDNYVILNGGGYIWTKESEVKIQNDTLTLYLPTTATSWRVYPLDKSPIKGNEKGFLRPSKFGGLEYEILGWAEPNVAIIQTRDFGQVKIYVAPSTGAVIK